MSYKISKELFEAVMGFCKNEVAEMYVSDENIFWHTYEDEFIGNKDSKINVDTFFFKCKEWILKQDDIVIMSGNNSPAGGNNKVCHILIREEKDWRAFMSDSEQQAVFDACQWLVDTRVEYEG